MKRIYFFDIDNTLLDHQSNAIPDSALLAIAGLRSAGHTVVIATGRSYGQARPFIEQIQPSYVISQNGARILQGEQEVLAIPLAHDPLKALFDWVKQQGHYYGINDGEFAHVSDALPIALKPLHSVALATVNDLDYHLRNDIHQAWLFFDEALDATLKPQILELFPAFDLVRWHKTAVDVMPRGINKWTGCQWILARTGFAPRQAIAFGDGLNDMEMLQGVGLGIAMDNGHPALKAVAKRIAPALHLDGIATMLAELAHTQGHGQPA